MLGNKNRVILIASHGPIGTICGARIPHIDPIITVDPKPSQTVVNFVDFQKEIFAQLSAITGLPESKINTMFNDTLQMMERVTFTGKLSPETMAMLTRNDHGPKDNRRLGRAALTRKLKRK